MLVTLICQSCGKEFHRPSSYLAKHDAKHCSNECRKRQVTKQCLVCGQDFSVKASHADNRVTCSMPCYSRLKASRTGAGVGNWRGGPQEVTCIQCGKIVLVDPNESETRKFCSVACKGQWTSENALGENAYNWQGGPVILTCKQCQKSFGVDSHRADTAFFCTKDCYSQWMSENLVGDAHPSWKGGPIPYYGDDWKYQRSQARERDNYTCQLCGIREFELGQTLEVHHITPFREFGIERYKEANRLDNLISLCTPCHHHAEANPALLGRP